VGFGLSPPSFLRKQIMTTEIVLFTIVLPLLLLLLLLVWICTLPRPVLDFFTWFHPELHWYAPHIVEETVVALTIDDGPSEATGELLAVLEKSGVLG